MTVGGRDSVTCSSEVTQHVPLLRPRPPRPVADRHRPAARLVIDIVAVGDPHRGAAAGPRDLGCRTLSSGLGLREHVWIRRLDGRPVAFVLARTDGIDRVVLISIAAVARDFKPSLTPLGFQGCAVLVIDTQRHPQQRGRRSSQLLASVGLRAHDDGYYYEASAPYGRLDIGRTSSASPGWPGFPHIGPWHPLGTGLERLH